jgi:asparagine synthase (glutamine-hydrolysing)
MCGICGKLYFDREAQVSPAVAKMMADSIQHRGPDDEGFYINGQVGLGFRRLSIIDLQSGHQPLSNEDGRVWIVFNGEIYNYKHLREELISKGHLFKTQTDTEVIVHLYEEFGERCVEKLRGMFAFAIWDDRAKVLFLARDRVGIKPLYYYLTDKFISFGSEIKALLADSEFEPELRAATIDRFLTFNYVPGEETLFQNVYKLSPGSSMTVRDGKVKTTQYWDLDFTPSGLSLEEAEKQLLCLLEETVELHMISDVPVGFLLSGGVDSTAILSLASQKTNRAISSYTIGFSSSPGVIDERPFARLAAARYGSEHHEMTIGANDFLSFLDKYIWHMEEPVCEPPAVALFYVSKLARNHVKVLLSGEGGDEAFGGYSNYRNLMWLEDLKGLSTDLNGVFSSTCSAIGKLLGSERIAKYAPLFATPFDKYYYSRTASPFNFFNSHYAELYTKDFSRVVDKQQSVTAVNKYLRPGPPTDLLNRMLYVDTKTWLVDDLLLKADKMTMANSIELRVPLLDHKVLEFAASLPGKFKVHAGTTKYIAKKTLGKLVPREIIKRKKAGFPVPYSAWLRTDMKDWVRDILFGKQTIARGYFNQKQIENLLSENSARGRYSKEIFSLVVLELWHRSFLEGRPSSVNESDLRLATKT